MGWLSWFSKPKDDDYESILSNLARDVDKRKSKLADIRSREQRTQFAITLYTVSAYVLYVVLWYMRSLPPLIGMGIRVTRDAEKALKGVFVLVGPVLIFALRRVVQIWYSRKGNAEERQLQSALKLQRTKVEEIKKKTNYYETRELLQRYDESPSSPLLPPGTPVRKGPRQSMVPQTPGSPAQNLPSASASPQAPQTVQGRQWFDKLADAMLGQDEAADAARYALICEECFAHNGLVKESAWDEVQYVCPKCQHFNASRRSRGIAGTPPTAQGQGQGKRVVSPGSPMPSISAPGPTRPTPKVPPMPPLTSNSPNAPGLTQRPSKLREEVSHEMDVDE
ncbi:hypothetical protein CYLTODRAFT_401875 [Cylindrobasidium torrendii FP15055 ss-10]|uniref:Endoplasmic reticulum junction formation protein lunapark n=1 Tax=Cylindrobasidium torrendii FP15055 ss-10 TaxID=1314674 RepID=A0A0D7B1U3_9AGAR|nr:hypothetical protein CYLTODRAFT_401875 [Cylindrobasidium torrendii FP15055 ss-10]